MSKDLLMFCIWMCRNCNRQCPNCYTNVFGMDDKMTIETAKDVATWINKIVTEEDVKTVRISMLGGEPTTNIDSVYGLVDSLNLPHKDIISGHRSFIESGISKHIFTNGDFLDVKMLEELKKRNISIMLNPTYDPIEEIERKILLVKTIFDRCSLAIALNSINLERLPQLTELAIKHKTHMRINRLYEGGTIPGYIKMYAKQMSKMFDLIIESGWRTWPCWIIESTYPLWEGPENCYTCGKNFIVITPDGQIKSCNPDPDTVMGSIYTIDHFNELKFPQRWSAKNLPECQDCEWMGLCQGGCPYTRKLTYGTYDHKSPFCNAFKKLFPKLMILKQRWLDGLQCKTSD